MKYKSKTVIWSKWNASKSSNTHKNTLYKVATRPVTSQQTQPCQHNASCNHLSVSHLQTMQHNSDEPKPALQSTTRFCDIKVYCNAANKCTNQQTVITSYHFSCTRNYLLHSVDTPRAQQILVVNRNKRTWNESKFHKSRSGKMVF